MCYLIAKRFVQKGCIALETSRGKELSNMVIDLSKRTSGKGVRILSVSSMEAYGEYKPYSIVKTKEEFVTKVLGM